MEGGLSVESKEIIKTPLTYHHSRPIDTIIYDNVSQAKPKEITPQNEKDIEAFGWIEKQVGFYPLFMAVGRTETDLKMTGYHRQFKRKPDPYRTDESQPRAVFSYRKPPPNGVYTDYPNWEDMYVVNNPHEYVHQEPLRRLDVKLERQVEEGILTQEQADALSDEAMEKHTGPVPRKIVRGLLRPSWNDNDWVSYANKHPHHVQYVVPQLDLREADSIIVGNKEMQKKLEQMGFKNVEVQRVSVKEPDY
jgi:hypothetical protein